MDYVGGAFKFLSAVAVKPAAEAAQRNDQIVAVLRKLRLEGPVPPADFGALYARTVIDVLYGKPAPVLALFRDQYVRQAFTDSFHSDDYSRLLEEVAGAVERNAESSEFGHLPYRIADEIGPVIERFHYWVTRSRTPAQARFENKLDALQVHFENQLDALPARIAADLLEIPADKFGEMARVALARQDEEQHRQEREPHRGSATPLERLNSDVRAWFATLNYRVTAELGHDDTTYSWTLRAPVTPGRYGTVVILVVDGELMKHYVSRAIEAVREHAADGAWVIAQQRISPSARQGAAEMPSVLCLTFDDLIDLNADFEPYLDWLEDTVRKLRMEQRYVELSCRREEPGEEQPSLYDWKDGGLTEYVHRWLADPAKEHLSVLGEFGTGKSWFALHFAWRLGRLWREAKRRGLPRPRLPLLIPLRTYAKAATVESVISQFFFAEHQLELNYRTFQHLNKMGRLLLIFDGFDEMAARVDRNVMVSNFWELAKVAEPGAKVLLSSRTEHFPDAEGTRQLLAGNVHAAAVSDVEPLRFDIIEIAPMDVDQIRAVLTGITDEYNVKVVMNNEELRDLLRRPVMSELVLEALPDIGAGQRIDMARVYLYAVRRKMDRDIREGRTFTGRPDKLYFLCELAWEMLSTSTMSLNYREFPDRLRTHFGTAVSSPKDIDHWDQDMRSQTLLVRNADGDYSPAHRSLLEFFVAYKLGAELGLLDDDFLDLVNADPRSDGSHYRWSEYFMQHRTNGALPALSRFTAEASDRLASTFGRALNEFTTFQFLWSMISGTDQVKDQLLALARTTGSLPDPQNLGGNCLNLLRFAAPDLAGVNLAGANLAGANPHHDLAISSLAHADLRGADLSGVAMRWTSITGADLTGAFITDVEVLRTFTPQVAVTSFGSIVCTDFGALTDSAVWENGNLHDSPEHEKIGPTDRRRSVAALTNGQVAISATNGLIVRDPDGSTRRALQGRSVVQIVPMEWRSEPAMAVLTRHKGINQYCIVLEDGLRPVAQFDPPDPLRHALTSRVQMRYTRSGELRLLYSSLAGQSEMFALLDDGRWGRSISLKYRTVWASDFLLQHSETRKGSWTVDLLDLDGQSVWQRSVESSAELPSSNLLVVPTYVVIVGTGRGVSAWPMPTGPALWEHEVALGVEKVIAHPDGQSFLSVSGSGEIAHRLISNGEIISRTSVNDHLRGTRFSRACGFNELVLDSLELAGAVIVP
ncbi:pentapeptide repeat-containing protein [Catellatospora sp. KI3]|uniref:NACHT domain-containing protein n=1 Tax=Catellatospora sp. KI3 TaxID=3041620 RepID=UPI0024828634|nr:pentapeptide repeat-containing protein [Catellatospora sp. KI3]MDI1463274.1 pentapeptide repeat-containing protein [Catellatospora sp. KI3]